MDSVKILVERGANVNFVNPNGSNQALKAAAENDREQVWEYLIAKGAVPDLITAAMLGLADWVEQILSKDPAAIETRDSHGRGALDAATLLDTFRRSRGGLDQRHDRVAKILIGRGAKMEAGHAASLGLLDELKRMVGRDPDVLRRPREIKALLGGAAVMESPLRSAKRRGHTLMALST